MARGTGSCKTVQARMRTSPTTLADDVPEYTLARPRAHPVKTPTCERTGVAELDVLIEAFLAADPEIPDEWLDMHNESRIENGHPERVRPHKRLSDLRFDPAAGSDQPSLKQCGNAADLFDRLLAENGGHSRGWGAQGFLREPGARPELDDKPPEREGYHFVFYRPADGEPGVIAAAGITPEADGRISLATTPEAAGPGPLVRFVVSSDWLAYQPLVRVGRDRFALTTWEADPDWQGLPADALRSVATFDPTAEPKTGERIEIIGESDPRHPTNRIAAGMDPNPFDLVMEGKLDIEEGLDWSVLYGYADGKYRRRRDKTHQTTVVLLDGQMHSIDFTAGQYGFDDAFPMVQRYDPAANAWARAL